MSFPAINFLCTNDFMPGSCKCKYRLNDVARNSAISWKLKTTTFLHLLQIVNDKVVSLKNCIRCTQEACCRVISSTTVEALLSFVCTCTKTTAVMSEQTLWKTLENVFGKLRKKRIVCCTLHTLHLYRWKGVKVREGCTAVHAFWQSLDHLHHFSCPSPKVEGGAVQTHRWKNIDIKLLKMQMKKEVPFKECEFSQNIERIPGRELKTWHTGPHNCVQNFSLSSSEDN